MSNTLFIFTNFTPQIFDQTNYDYNDKMLYEDREQGILIVYYRGQQQGRFDKYLLDKKIRTRK